MGTQFLRSVVNFEQLLVQEAVMLIENHCVCLHVDVFLERSFSLELRPNGCNRKTIFILRESRYSHPGPERQGETSIFVPFNRQAMAVQSRRATPTLPHLCRTPRCLVCFRPREETNPVASALVWFGKGRGWGLCAYIYVRNDQIDLNA